MPRWLRLFFIGLLLGGADLIPGISGGTVAFISGIYEELLQSIRSLQLSFSKKSCEKVNWGFLLPFGSGAAISLLFFSRIVFFLLASYRVGLYALFLGLILASATSVCREIDLKKGPNWILIVIGFMGAFILSGRQNIVLSEIHFSWLFFTGFLASIAMLLPGISGSFLMHLMGVYPIVILSLSNPTNLISVEILACIGFGIAMGLIISCRIIIWSLELFREKILSLLLGLMLGGMRSLWTFSLHDWKIAFSLAALGFLAVFIFEMMSKRKALSKQ